jgi:Flp pilus assembly secretin CpaC
MPGRRDSGYDVMMNDNSQGVGRSRKLLFVLAIVAAGWIGGCGDFFAERSAELEADKTLRTLTQIKPVSEPNIPIPQIYKAPPKIVRQTVGGVDEWKLFYFSKYQTAEQLRDIVQTQFAMQLFNKPGQTATTKDWTISANPATNQLIVRGPSEDDISAILELLEAVDVAPIQIKIDCMISEVYADVTIDRETTLLIENLLGEHVTMGGKETSTGELLPAFPGAALRDIARSKFGLKIGYVTGKDDHWFKALVDILESKGYLKILMNPELQVVNGQKAKIRAEEHVPLQQVYLRDLRSEFLETRTEYVDVIDELEITPHAFADGSIGLEVRALIGAKSTPEGVKQIPVVTEREIDNKENRLRPGESLIIGGIRKSERRDVVRGIPGLKDLPLIGLLFSSRDFEERAKETIFIITPTISAGGVPNKEMVERLKREHEPPEPPESFDQTLTDPFGTKASARHQERELMEAERVRLEAAREKAVARSIMRAADEKAQKAESEAAKALIELRKVKAEATQMKADADKARADAEAKLKAAEAAKTTAEKATTDATKIKAEAEKALAEAQAARAQADAKTKSADQALAEAEAKAKAALNALSEAQAKADAAEKAKAEAQSPKQDAPQNKSEPNQPKTPDKPQEGQQPGQNPEQKKPESDAQKSPDQKAAPEPPKQPKGQGQDKPKNDSDAGGTEGTDSTKPKTEKPAGEEDKPSEKPSGGDGSQPPQK